METFCIQMLESIASLYFFQSYTLSLFCIYQLAGLFLTQCNKHDYIQVMDLPPLLEKVGFQSYLPDRSLHSHHLEQIITPVHGNQHINLFRHNPLLVFAGEFTYHTTQTLHEASVTTFVYMKTGNQHTFLS